MNPAGNTIEHRALPGGELRAEGAGTGPRSLRGYAALYSVDSLDLGGYTERIKRGAFADALRPTADVRAFWGHDASLVLGRTTSGTMALRDDERGLFAEIQLPDTTWAKDAWETIRRGDVNQMSFGFQVIRDSWEDDRKTGRLIRTLLEVRLIEVSPVAVPAYQETSVVARSRSGPATAAGMRNLYAAKLRLLDLAGQQAGMDR